MLDIKLLDFWSFLWTLKGLIWFDIENLRPNHRCNQKWERVSNKWLFISISKYIRIWLKEEQFRMFCWVLSKTKTIVSNWTGKNFSVGRSVLHSHTEKQRNVFLRCMLFIDVCQTTYIVKLLMNISKKNPASIHSTCKFRSSKQAWSRICHEYTYRNIYLLSSNVRNPWNNNWISSLTRIRKLITWI